jgi:acyl-CoA synthetase (AMP-forming)/AMP-acid ligase II
LPGFTGDRMTYRDVARVVSRMAGALRELGARTGDRVGLFTRNRIEMAFANFAVAKLGAIPVPLNFMLRPNEIEHVVQRAGIELLVVDRAIFRDTIADRANVPSVKRWAVIDDADPAEGLDSLPLLMREMPDHVPPVEPASQDDVAIIFFTSGTTGFPKGAMLSHNSAMIGLRTHCRIAAMSPRVPRRLALLVMPVAHVAGYSMLLLNLGLGTPVYFLSRFDPTAIFECLDHVRPTVFAGSPTMFRLLLAAGASEHDWSCIRTFGGGSDAFDDELVGTVRDLGARRGPFGMRLRPGFIRGYGMAEANSHVSQTPWFETGDNCCGWVMPPVRYRIVDDDGRDVRRGEPGELLLKGPNLTKGYWGDPEATAAAIDAGGWFHTGDLMRAGKWRMLYFIGRSDDIIKSGGYKISASEIDQQLRRHPDVESSATVIIGCLSASEFLFWRCMTQI